MENATTTISKACQVKRICHEKITRILFKRRMELQWKARSTHRYVLSFTCSKFVN